MHGTRARAGYVIVFMSIAADRRPLVVLRVFIYKQLSTKVPYVSISYVLYTVAVRTISWMHG